MRRYTFFAPLVTSAIALACSQQPTASPSASDATTTAIAAEGPSASRSSDDDFQWGPAPAVFPAGAQMAVLQGNPASTDLFTVRLRFPNGYVIPPHTHPTDENVTVIYGNFKVGMGTAIDPASMLTLHEGGFITAPANMAHYAAAQGRTEVQVHAMGPFAMTYVGAHSASQSPNR
jgi:quercetin dioxygenase-like cupin family protein